MLSQQLCFRAQLISIRKRRTSSHSKDLTSYHSALKLLDILAMQQDYHNAVRQGRSSATSEAYSWVRHREVCDRERRLAWAGKKAAFPTIVLIRHLVIVQPEMMPDLMHDRIADFLHDFCLRATDPENRPAIDRDFRR
jgi:hypothetical protein